MILHAGLLALRAEGRWRGVLIEGPSGAGKSDLALRALDADFELVADDRTLVWVSGGRLFGRAPPALSGLIEARGLGVLAQPARPMVEIRLVVACADGPIERMPEPQTRQILGIDLPLARILPLEAAAPVKLRRALLRLGAAD